MKPSNLLLTSYGVLKIADFGQARLHTHGSALNPPNELYSHNVATRWYRAPELLFGARRYGTGVDMWAVGAIFGQLLQHSPLFPGENDIDQLFKVIHALGAPTELVWPGVSELPDFAKVVFPDSPPMPLETLCPDASPLALLLLGELIVYSPARRLSAHTATIHGFFLADPPPGLATQLPVPRGGAAARRGAIAPGRRAADEALAPINDPIEFPWARGPVDSPATDVSVEEHDPAYNGERQSVLTD